jgi:hypothetical protein
MAGLRIAYALCFDGERVHYEGVLLDGTGQPRWKCGHHHAARSKSPAPGPLSGSAVFTSALDCAREELGRRAEVGATH